MLVFLTLLIFLAALCHLFVAVYNRYLLGITDSWWKPYVHLAWFLISVVIPAGVVLWMMNASHDGPVWEALSWSPQGTAGRVLFAAMGIVIVIFGARLLLWIEERLFPDHPNSLIEENVSRAVVPQVRSQLPRPLRRLDTTSDLVVTEREIAVAGLAPAFDGLRIVQVADVHFTQRLEMENYLEGVRAVVASLNADIIVLTGDFVDTRRDIARGIDYHAGFRGRLGTFYVMGNHDYWTNAERLKEGFDRTHLRWLGGGERRTLKRMGRRLIFTGTDAPWSGNRADWRRLARRDTGDAVIVLSHTPDNGPIAAQNGASLILSGHNHGGQICLPLVGPIVVPSRYGLRYAGGIYQVGGGDSLLNVSRGVGCSSGKIRVLCPPEVCVLTLRAPIVEVMVGRVIPARAILKPVEESAGEEGGVMGY